MMSFQLCLAYSPYDAEDNPARVTRKISSDELVVIFPAASCLNRGAQLAEI